MSEVLREAEGLESFNRIDFVSRNFCTTTKTNEETQKHSEQTKTIEHLLSQVTTIKQERNLLLNKNERMKKEKASLTEQLDKKEQEIETVRKRSDDLRIQREKTEGKVQSFTEENRKLEECVKRLKSEVSELEDEISSMENEKDLLSKKNREQMSKFDSIKAENSRLKKNVAAKHFRIQQISLELEKSTSNTSPKMEEMQKELMELRNCKMTQEKWNKMLKSRIDVLLKEQSERQDTEVMLRASVQLLEDKECP